MPLVRFWREGIGIGPFIYPLRAMKGFRQRVVRIVTPLPTYGLSQDLLYFFPSDKIGLD